MAMHRESKGAAVPRSVAQYVREAYWPMQSRVLMQKRSHLTREWAILEGVIDQWGHRRLGDLHRQDIDMWLARLQARYKPSTFNRHLVRIKHAFRVAQDWYGIPSPVAHARKLRARGRKRLPTVDERERLLAGSPPALARYIVAASQTGQRREALWAMRVRDVDLRGGTITFPMTKNGEPLTVPLTQTMRGYLYAWWYLRMPGPAEYALPHVRLDSITQAFSRTCRRLGIHDLHFHDLRRGFGTALAAHGLNLPQIMQATGHLDPRMALRYIELAESEELRRAMDAAL